MNEYILPGLVAILALGIGAQWLAWRMRISVVLLLVILGLMAGPVSGFLHPDELFGELLVPLVSLSVALILFEGGMSLRIRELKSIGRPVRRLISTGVIINWGISSLAAYYLLGLNVGLAAILGGIIVVTGPTVITPLLKQVRPTGKVSSILRWEGILIDPIGAILALLIFEAVLAGDMHAATINAVLDFLRSLLIGGSIGLLGSAFIVLFIKNFWVPDSLQNPVVLVTVVSAFAVSNLLQAESGLLAATVMGIALANQRFVPVKRIIDFKESLQVLLISSLFIILTARLEISTLQIYLVPGLLFLLVLIFLARPASVMLSTLGTGLSIKERFLISFIAPRGIVAIAVSSVFALRLGEVGYFGAEALIPLSFITVIGTVVFYSLTAFPLARLLGLSQPNPQGLLIVGAHSWAREIAAVVQAEGYPILMVDTNTKNTSVANSQGIEAINYNILSETIERELDLSGLGKLLCLTANDEVNSLATLYFVDTFGYADVYQLPFQNENDVPRHLRGRFLFRKDSNYSFLADFFADGGMIDTIEISNNLSYDELRKRYGKFFVPLFLIDEVGNLLVITGEKRPSLKEGCRLIYLYCEKSQYNEPELMVDQD